MPLRRIGLLALLSLAAVNLFTGAPIAALWIGALVQGESGGVSMGAVFTVVVAMALACAALVWALSRLGDAYDRAAGRPPARRRQTTWLRPFNERGSAAAGTALGALDIVLVVAVVLAVLAFEAWFFFYAGSPIG